MCNSNLYTSSTMTTCSSLTGSMYNGNIATVNYQPYITTFGSTDIGVSDHTEFIGDVKITGNILLDGDMYQHEDKVTTKKKQNNDVEIEVVDNGFLARIDKKHFVFSDIDQLDEWIKTNFKTPEEAKKTVREAKGLTKLQDDALDAFKKIDFTQPIIQPIQPFAPYTRYPQSTWDTGTTYVTNNTSNTTKSGQSFMNKLFGKKRKEV